MMNIPPLPGHPHLHYAQGQLQLEGVRLADLAARHGTPLYVYSRAAMLDALAAYQRGFKGRKARICYAMKANSSLAILQLFAQAGCGFDIVSGGELERVLAAGGDPSTVVFSGVGKTRGEMRQALKHLEYIVHQADASTSRAKPSWKCSAAWPRPWACARR